MPVSEVSRRSSPTALACALLLAAGSAAAQAPEAARNPDPYEHWNRKVFAFNQSLYAHVFRPAAMAWKHVVPAPFRAGLRNAYSNLGEPVVMINDAIQGRGKDAATSFGRFALNSTAGIAGLVDYAKREGLAHHDNGFGTTLGRWGARPGPYIYLPVLGPSDVRDGFGSGVDVLLNPQTWIGYGARPIVGGVETVSSGLNTFADADPELQTLKATSTDEYATLRSLYLQNRQAQIRGEAVDVNALPDFDDPSRTAPAAAGAVSPTGAPPLKRPGTNGPSGDAAALPQAAGSPTSAPPPISDSPAPRPDAETAPD